MISRWTVLTHVHSSVGANQGVDRGCEPNQAGYTHTRPAHLLLKASPNLLAWGVRSKNPQRDQDAWKL